MKYYYTEKEFKTLCGDIEILCDTREQENEHILNWFDKKKVQHCERALKYGDYCFRISPKSNVRLAAAWFTDEVFIERKNSLDELASSLTSQRFYRELREAVRIEHKYLIVENANGYNDIFLHKYRNDYDPKAFYNTLQSLQFKYDIHVIFVPSEATKYLTGQQIWSICKTALKASLITQ